MLIIYCGAKVDFSHVEDLPITDTRKPRKPGTQSTKNNNDKYGIDLSQPRPYKVVHPGAAENGTDAVTLFWVVPGTSGLVAAYPVSDLHLLSQITTQRCFI
jgi:hypothetical protein